MKMDIGVLIESLLYENDNLVIPGFGVFTSKPTSASIDYLGETIAPPSKLLSFDETVQSNDGLLVQKVMESANTSTAEAEQIVTAYVAKLNEVLDNREIVTIPGVGRLYKNYARKIQFLPETTNFRADAYGLPSLQAASHQVNKAAGATTVSVGAPSNGTLADTKPTSTTAPEPLYHTQQHTRRLPQKIWLLLGALLLAAAVGLGYMLVQKKKSNHLPSGSPKAEIPAAASPVTAALEGAKAAVEQEKAEQQKQIPPISSPKDDIPDEVAEASAKQKATIEQKVKTNDSHEKVVKKAPETTGKRRCVLVIGTFQEKNNVEKLIEKLQANGYDTYHRRVEGQHQVGVEFRYDELRDIQKVMEHLQKLTGQDNIWIKKK